MMITKKENTIDKLKKRNSKKIQEIYHLKEKIKFFNVQDNNMENKFDDLFRELVIEKQKTAKIEALNKRIASLEENSKQKENIEKLIQELKLPVNNPEKFKKLVKKWKKSDIIFKKINQRYSDENILNTVDKLSELISENKIIKQKLSSSQGQIKNLQNKVDAVGKGTEMPPCWADPNTGKTEYIFDVALSSTGFTIRDRQLQHRRDEQSKLPIDKITLNKEISAKEFRKEYLPLLNWCTDNNCRFFVKAFDLTMPEEKNIYKKQMRILGERFYIYETNNETFHRLQTGY